MKKSLSSSPPRSSLTPRAPVVVVAVVRIVMIIGSGDDEKRLCQCINLPNTKTPLRAYKRQRKIK